MKIRFHHILPVVILIVACNKDKFTTEPQVSVKSVSPSEVRQGSGNNFTVITLDAKFTDDQGDLDSLNFVTKYYDGDVVTFSDSIWYSIAELDLPKKTREGDIKVQFEYNTNNSGGTYLPFFGVPKDTTATLGIVLLDAAKHRSNYSESSKIRLIAP